MDENSFGVLWDGQYEALNRLILGLGYDIGTALIRHGIAAQDASRLQAELIKDLYATLAVPAMPIQDAVDGAIGIAAITKHEGFRWVQRAELAS